MSDQQEQEIELEALVAELSTQNAELQELSEGKDMELSLLKRAIDKAEQAKHEAVQAMDEAEQAREQLRRKLEDSEMLVELERLQALEKAREDHQ